MFTGMMILKQKTVQGCEKQHETGAIHINIDDVCYNFDIQDIYKTFMLGDIILSKVKY